MQVIVNSRIQCCNFDVFLIFLDSDTILTILQCRGTCSLPIFWMFADEKLQMPVDLNMETEKKLQEYGCRILYLLFLDVFLLFD